VIPKRIFRIWLGNTKPKPIFEAWWERFEELHPAWELATIRDGDADSIIDGELRNAYYFCSTYSERTDILRHPLLYRFGGVYVDCDVFPIKPLDPLMNEDSPFFCWQTKACLETAVVGSPASHPAIKAVMDFLPKHYWNHAQESPHVSTGPAAVSRVLVPRTDIRKLPKEAFMPVGRCNVKLFMSRCLNSSGYVGHFAGGSWWSEAKKRRETGRRAVI
jgi:mannosyltransferase OCH1-like enzyme